MLIDCMDAPEKVVEHELRARVKAGLSRTRLYRRQVPAKHGKAREECLKMLRWWQRYLVEYRRTLVALRATHG